VKLSIQSLKNRIKSCFCDVLKRISIVHIMDYDKHKIFLNDNIRLASCGKEPETVKWIEEFGKDDIVFDVGANVGAYALIMGKYTKKVYAFEPSSFTFNTLIKNIRTNKASNVVPLNVALSDRKKTAEFIYSSTVPGSSAHGLEMNRGEDNYRQEMLAYDVDTLVSDFGIDPPVHIKIDVDGTEMDILNGARHTMESAGFKTLMVEAQKDDAVMYGYLKGLGLEKSKSVEIGREDRCNYFYVKKS
jgi:FkbM family methyltransferase